MYRTLVLLFVLVAAVLAEDEMKKCRKLFHPPGMMSCCLKKPVMPACGHDPEQWKECMDKPMGPHNCEREECIAEKKGIFKPGKGIDYDALSAVLEKNPDLLAASKAICYKDLSKYGPEHECDVVKMRHCVQAQIYMLCEEWSDEGDCSEMKDLVVECKDILK